MGRIAVSISHEADYAVAIAFGIRTAGGTFVFPLDIEARLDDRERQDPRAHGAAARSTTEVERARARRLLERGASPGRRRWLIAGRSASAAREDSHGAPGAKPVPAGRVALDDRSMAMLLPERDPRGHKGSFGKLLVIAGSIDYAGAGLLVCRGAGRAGAGLVTLAVPESLQPLFAAKVVEATTMALPEDDLEEVDPEPSLAKILDHEHDALVIGPGLRPALATSELLRLLMTLPEEPTPAPAVVDAEALRALASADDWWTATTRAVRADPALRRVRQAPGREWPRAGRGRRSRERRRGAGSGGEGGGGRMAPGGRPQGRADRHRQPGGRGRGRAVRESRARERRHGRRHGRRDRRAARAGAPAVGCGPARRVPPRAGGRVGSRADR